MFYPLLSAFYILHHFQNKLIFTSIKIEIERWNIHNSSGNNTKNSDVIFSFNHSFGKKFQYARASYKDFKRMKKLRSNDF